MYHLPQRCWPSDPASECKDRGNERANRDKLNNMYGQLSGNVHVMNQVKVTRRGVPGMPLNEKMQSHAAQGCFSERKTLCECINLGKALAK